MVARVAKRALARKMLEKKALIRKAAIRAVVAVSARSPVVTADQGG
jgi:hypothetical protein